MSIGWGLQSINVLFENMGKVYKMYRLLANPVPSIGLILFLSLFPILLIAALISEQKGRVEVMGHLNKIEVGQRDIHQNITKEHLPPRLNRQRE